VPHDVRHGFLDDAQYYTLRLLIQSTRTSADCEVKHSGRAAQGSVCRNLYGSHKLLLFERAWPYVPDNLSRLAARVLGEIRDPFERHKRVIGSHPHVRERGSQLQSDASDVLKQGVVNLPS
jgi:hypothetical protein